MAEELNRIRDSAHLPFESRRRILVDLAKTADENPATEALMLLVWDHDPDAVRLSKDIVDRTYGTEAVGRVLGVAANHFLPIDRRDIARQFLEKVRNGLQVEKPGFPMVSLAGSAAILLSDSQSTSDQVLVQSSWERNPEEFGYMVALVSLGVTPGSGWELANSFYSDVSKQLWLRVAASAILSAQHRRAAEFCSTELGKLLTDFGSRDALERVRNPSQGSAWESVDSATFFRGKFVAAAKDQRRGAAYLRTS